MTQEEISDFLSLSSDGQFFYNQGKRSHPEWTHDQVMAYVSVCLVGFGTPGKVSSIREIFTAMLKKAEEYMLNNFPGIYIRVKDYFSKAIVWLKNAINVTIDKIIEFFN